MKTLRNMLVWGTIVLASILPFKKINAQEINPFVQPNATTIFRGSGDVDGDGDTGANDYSAMQNDSLTCIQADIDIDGIPSTQNDLELLRQNIQEGKTLPADYNKLSTEAQRLDLDRKTALVNKLENIQLPTPWANNRCSYLALQTIIDQEGYYGDTFLDNFDLTKNGQANLPIFYIGIRYPDGTTKHALTGKAIGDSLNGDIRIWENWCLRDPSAPEKEVKIGDPNLKNIDSTEVRIGKINTLWDDGHKADYFIKFLILHGKATCTYYDTANLVLERPTTPVEDISGGAIIPTGFDLKQNFPNPFNGETTIRYELLKESDVLLNVYNILGQKLETLVDENQAPGIYEVLFDASKYSSGIKFYRLETDDFTKTKRMIYLK